jgi:collagenase-like protein with putative collagen-binding domain/VCBS repeat protein
LDFKSFFNGTNWYDLVSDQGHTLLTAGYGTFNDNNVLIANNNYATAAMNSNGSLAVIYSPASHTLTVAMGNFSGQVAARWFDPTNNTFTTVSGSPFPNSGSHNFMTPGNNSGGDPDWVLLLQSGAGSPTPTPTPTAMPTPTVVDFNGDGHPDYVLQNASTHQTAIWYLNNNVYVGSAYGPILAAGWSLRGVADFNRDSHADYALFAPNTRQTAIWYLSGPTFIGGGLRASASEWL